MTKLVYVILKYNYYYYIDEIFTVDLTLTTNVKSTVKILSIFVAFIEKMNFTIVKKKIAF